MNKTIVLFLASLVIMLGLQTGVDAQRNETSRGVMCMTNTQCRSNHACVNLRCMDPCEDTCGTNAKCNVRNHVVACSCPAGYTGDALSACTTI